MDSAFTQYANERTRAGLYWVMFFEGTTLSEGRGTTKLFEIFGAPFLPYSHLDRIKNEVLKEYPYNNESYQLRPLQFVTAFHKHEGEICNGFQLHVRCPGYHSLMLSLLLFRAIQNITVHDIFLKGPYEYDSERPAIEILLGDDLLLDFVRGRGNAAEIQKYLRENEQWWIEESRSLGVGLRLFSL